MIEKVEHFISRHQLLKKNSVIVAGVSGGPDSLALLHYLWSMKDKWGFKLICAHVDHMFRGKESEEDYEYVKSFCEQRGIIFEGTAINVMAYQAKRGLSSQVAARECRYNFFKQIMEHYQADQLVLGHHGDDQIETVLMRLVRGSFTSGLAGIQVRRKFGTGEMIRPLLSITKDEIEAYCKAVQIEPRIDLSNMKDTYTRNRFRHHVLPFLKSENPKVHERFQYMSEVMREEHEYLEGLAAEKLDGMIQKRKSNEISLSLKLFHKVPIPLQRRCIHLILNYLYKEIPSSISSIHIEDALLMFKSRHPSGRLSFPKGLFVIRSYDECLFTFTDLKQASYSFELGIPDTVSLPTAFEISSQIVTNESLEAADEYVLLCKEEEICAPFTIRTRENGDRMTLFGMKGSKKVKDIFIDQKIPHDKRNQWPILEDAKGNILWIPGIKKSSYAIRHANEKHNYILFTHRPYNEDA